MPAQKTMQTTGTPDLVDDQGESINEVRLRGRLAETPRLRELPSGDTVWNLRVAVQRPPVPQGKERPRQRVDSLECAIWAGRLRRQVEKWEAGDLVEVTGAMRRR